MISQNDAHEKLELLKKIVEEKGHLWKEVDTDFVMEFYFEGVENHWFTFRQLERIEEISKQYIGDLK